MNDTGNDTERVVAAWLKWGTLASAGICLAGLAVMMTDPAAPDASATADLARCPWPCGGIPGGTLVLAGVLALVAVSSGRLALLAGLFLRKGDRAFAAIAATGFLLTLVAAVLAAAGM